MIHSYCGLLGHGKTHSMTEDALRLCNDTNKDLVTNVKIKMDELEDYCMRRGLYRMARKAARGQVFHDTELNRMFGFERCVVMVDELGIFANARKLLNSWDDFERFMFDLVLSRKAGIDFLWAAQDHEMVDKNIRRLTNAYWHTFRWFGKDLHIGKNRDIKFLTQFDASGYAKWSQDMSRQLWWKYKLAYKFRFFDSELFRVYNTLERLDTSTTYDLAHVAQQLGPLDPLSVPKHERKMIELPKGYQPRRQGECPVIDLSARRVAWRAGSVPQAAPAALSPAELEVYDDQADDLLARIHIAMDRGVTDFDTFRGLTGKKLIPASAPKPGPVIGTWPPPAPPTPRSAPTRKRAPLSADTLREEFSP